MYVCSIVQVSALDPFRRRTITRSHTVANITLSSPFAAIFRDEVAVDATQGRVELIPIVDQRVSNASEFQRPRPLEVDN